MAERYDWPWRNQVIHDDFTDGDYTYNPNWIVSQGKFTVDRYNGLKTHVLATQPVAQSHNENSDDLGKVLLGALLKELEDDKTRQSVSPSKSQASSAVIRTNAPISNAFAVQLELISRTKQGRIEFAVYTSEQQMPGYRLAYNPGARNSLELLRVWQRNSSVIQTADKTLTLEDRGPHHFEWTRDKRGNMKVKVDGRVVINTLDRGIGEDFRGFSIINAGGEYMVKSIKISGIQ